MSSIYSKLSLTLLIVLVYSNTILNTFHFDDIPSILEKPWIRGLDKIPEFIFAIPIGSFVRIKELRRALARKEGADNSSQVTIPIFLRIALERNNLNPSIKMCLGYNRINEKSFYFRRCSEHLLYNETAVQLQF